MPDSLSLGLPEQWQSKTKIQQLKQTFFAVQNDLSRKYMTVLVQVIAFNSILLFGRMPPFENRLRALLSKKMTNQIHLLVPGCHPPAHHLPRTPVLPPHLRSRPVEFHAR